MQSKDKIILDLTREEAYTLSAVTRLISGNTDETKRVHTDRIRKKLQLAGIDFRNLEEYALGTIASDSSNIIMSENYKFHWEKVAVELQLPHYSRETNLFYVYVNGSSKIGLSSDGDISENIAEFESYREAIDAITEYEEKFI